MNTLGERLKELRKEKRLSQTELSMLLNERFGLKTDRVMISKWETGFQTPVMNSIMALAEFFGVTTDYLGGSLKSLPYPTLTDDYVTFAVIGDVAAGYDFPAAEDWDGDTIEIPRHYLKGRNEDEFFVLRVKGDSMFPMYHDGDKVLILKQSTLNYSGQVGVVIYNGDIGTLKKVEYVSGEDWLRLIPVNPAFPPVKVEGEMLETCRVLGIPKLLIREIDD